MSKRRKFGREEKVAVVRLVTEGGSSRQHQTNPKLTFNGQHSDTRIVEADWMKRRILELENEVEFLKKVSVYFVKHPQ